MSALVIPRVAIKNRSPVNVTVSSRSWALLVGSTLAPITIAALRYASLSQRRAIARAAEHFFGSITGIVPDFVFFGGILCFVGFLVSLMIDYLRSRENT